MAVEFKSRYLNSPAVVGSIFLNPVVMNSRFGQILFQAQCKVQATTISESLSRKEQGVTLASEADEHSSGPASFMVMDPDGNPILVDQHM